MGDPEISDPNRVPLPLLAEEDFVLIVIQDPEAANS